MKKDKIMKYKSIFGILMACVLLPNYSTAQTPTWNQKVSVDYATGLLFDSNDSIFFIVQGDGLFKKEGSLNTDISTGLVTTNVVSLEMSGSDLWTGGYGGLTHLNGTTYVPYTLPGGNTVYDVDAEGSSVWVAMENEGASHFDGSTWTYYTSANGINGSWHTCVETDGGSNVYLGSTDWSGTGEGIVNFFDGTTWTSHSAANGITLTELTAIFHDSNGNIWIGGDAVMYYDGTTWNNVSVTVSNSIQSIAEDGDGNIWFGESGSNGVHMYDGTSVQTINAPSSFIGRPEGIAINSQGIPYFCLENGIYSYADTATGNTTAGDIESYDKSSALLIYPNPANDKIVINSTSEIEEVTLVNSLGQVLYFEKGIGVKQKVLDISNLDGGFYIVLLKTNDTILTQKIQIK